MKKIYITSIFITLLIASCNKSDEIPQNPSEKNTTLKNPVNNFTWKAMNSWYNWQTNVPNLSDTKDDNQDSYYQYLNGFSKPQDLFKSLIYREGVVDRFSWFIEDYVEQEKQFQGVYKTFGFRPAKVTLSDTDKTILLVTKVSKNSPASNAGLKRGDIIIGLNGTKFTKSNYSSVVKGYGNDIVEFILSENDATTEKSRVTITRKEVADDAIHLTKVFDNIGGKKVGYLVYNGFRSSYNKALNNAFAEFKSSGIQELILDLRYNGGGSVLSCGYLASLIYGEGQAEQEVFAKTIWNNKHPKSGFTLPFLNGIFTYDANGNYIKNADIPLNRLTGISKLYVITSNNTASASEMIINGLRPYMEVITVGTTTYGKNVGSVTLYDSPSSDYRNKNSANSSHKFAIQPITFQIFNKSGQSDYTTGFKPNIEVNEFQSWNNFLAFGDENEVILKTVLNKIKGVTARPAYTSNENVTNSTVESRRFEKEMYFENDYFNNKIN